MRKQLIEILNKSSDYEFIEDTISPFELQKADELFITNIVQGIQPITILRKKLYTTAVSQNILAKLNMLLRLS